jgi:hypothetical protein
MFGSSAAGADAGIGEEASDRSGNSWLFNPAGVTRTAIS